MGTEIEMDVRGEREREREQNEGRRKSWTKQKSEAGIHSLIGWQTVVGTSPSPTQFWLLPTLFSLPPCSPDRDRDSWLQHSAFCIPAFDMRAKHGFPRFVFVFSSLSLSVGCGGSCSIDVPLWWFCCCNFEIRELVVVRNRAIASIESRSLSD